MVSEQCATHRYLTNRLRLTLDKIHIDADKPAVGSEYHVTSKSYRAFAVP